MATVAELLGEKRAQDLRRKTGAPTVLPQGQCAQAMRYVHDASRDLDVARLLRAIRGSK